MCIRDSYTGYYDYLHMEFGRPTMLLIPRDEQSVLITPSIDYNTAAANARVDRIEAWNDGVGAEWREHLPGLLGGVARIGIEPDHMPPPVRSFIESLIDPGHFCDVSEVIAEMRTIKTDAELQLARHAGQVAIAMMGAGRAAIADGVPEYQVALATSAAGTQ